MRIARENVFVRRYHLNDVKIPFCQSHGKHRNSILCFFRDFRGKNMQFVPGYSIPRLQHKDDENRSSRDPLERLLRGAFSI